jgi:cytochrome c553
MRLAVGLFALALLLTTMPALLRMAHGADSPSKSPPAEAKPAEETDPLGANAACYVCHISFVKEELSKVHLAAKVACVKCHGLSDKHANDENIGATKPDIMYKRDQIDASCVKCHERHDVPPGKVIARFEERKLGISTKPVCSDCHGTHKIEREKPEAK